jgi:lysozyme
VSHHQGEIDWRLLPAQGVDFAYIKATEGADHHDPRFAANWAAARREGIARGAYHFFTLCRSGAEQAANFIATVPADPAMLRPAVDLEFGGNCEDRPPRAKLIRELTIFIRAIEAHYGKRVTLYLTREFDAGYEVSERIPRKLWLRSLVIEPSWGERPWSVWQASSFRSLRGVRGRVDWNVMR